MYQWKCARERLLNKVLDLNCFYCWLTDCAGELSSSFCVATFQDTFSPVLTCHKMADGIEMKHRGGMSILQVCVFVCSCLFWAQHLAVCVHVKRKVSALSADSELWSDFGSLNARRGLQHIFIISIHRGIVHRAGLTLLQQLLSSPPCWNVASHSVFLFEISRF